MGVTDLLGLPVKEVKNRDRRAYYQKNRERELLRSKAYYQKHRERLLPEKLTYNEANRDKIKAYRKANAEKYKANDRRYRLKTYGLTEQQFNKLLDAQANKCAICRTSAFGSHGPQIDHCAKAGHVRGILCGPCNRALGLFKHDISTLAGAITYMSKEVLFNNNGTNK